LLVAGGEGREKAAKNNMIIKGFVGFSILDGVLPEPP